MALPVIAVPWNDGAVAWGDALRPHRSAVRSLLAAFEREARSQIGDTAFSALVFAANQANVGFGAQFRTEIEEIADLAGTDPGVVIAANLAYDAGNAGCSTVACNATKSVLHFRNLDWKFPRRLLQKHTVVAKVTGAPAGDYAVVTWPGFFGALSAVAPGRFAITVNFVTHRAESSSKIRLGWRAAKGYWPVAWAVRNVLDGAPTFASAVKRLQQVEILAPVLLMVSGTRPGEAVVIERGVEDYAARRMGKKPAVFVTNHYETRAYENENVDDVDDVMNSGERWSRLADLLSERQPKTMDEAFDVLDDADLLYEITQQQMAMDAGQGRLEVRVPDGDRVVVTL